MKWKSFFGSPLFFTCLLGNVQANAEVNWKCEHTLVSHSGSKPYITFSSSTVTSKIIETCDFAHAFTLLDKDTLFIFDLDNTLIQTSQHLGSDQWFTHRLEHLIKEGVNAKDALEMIVPDWVAVQHHTEMDCVDSRIPSLLQEMQRKNVAMIGLTKRPPKMAKRTLEQISSLQINLHKTAPLQEDLIFNELHDTTYQQGIIFVAQEVEKGPAIAAYLKKMKKMPRKIVFVDDKLSHIQNVSASLEATGIIFIGIRYAGADDKIRGFNPEIADLQWRLFQKILSDEQALHLLQLENQ